MYACTLILHIISVYECSQLIPLTKNIPSVFISFLLQNLLYYNSFRQFVHNSYYIVKYLVHTQILSSRVINSQKVDSLTNYHKNKAASD